MELLNNQHENYLEVQLLSFHKSTEEPENFHFREMSTLQITKLITINRKIYDYP